MTAIFVFALIAACAFGYLTYHRGIAEAIAATAAFGAAIFAAFVTLGVHFQ